MGISEIILVSLFIEAIVNAIKPLWMHDAEKVSVTEIVSMAVGVLLAVVCKINMLYGVVEVEGAIEYLFYVLTGIAIGRGPSFLYDLWESIKKWRENK